MKFVINKDEKKRLVLFADQVKKIEAFCPLQDKALFYVDTKNNVMEVYSISEGGSGLAQAKFDVTFGSSPTADNSFVAELAQVVQAIGKVKSDDVNVSFEKVRIVFSNPKLSKNFVAVTVYPNMIDEVIEETRNLMTKTLGIDEFTVDPIEVTLSESNKKILEVFSDTTKLLDVNDSVLVERNSIKVADNLAVISLDLDDKQFVEKKFLFNRDVSGIIKYATKMIISSDEKWQYIELGRIGVSLLFQPRMPRFQYPTADEVLEISPETGTKSTVLTQDLFDGLEQFNGMFDSQKVKYGQVNVQIGEDPDIFLHYDDMRTEVQEHITATHIDAPDDHPYEFLLPFIHVSRLSPLFGDTVEIYSNGLEADIPHGMAVRITTGRLSMTIAKILS